jgi:hypothetical protein
VVQDKASGPSDRPGAARGSLSRRMADTFEQTHHTMSNVYLSTTLQLCTCGFRRNAPQSVVNSHQSGAAARRRPGPNRYLFL